MSNIKKVAVDDTTDATKVSSVEELAGVPEGTELNGEVVVADKDENGNVVGWHKEKKGGK